MLRGIAKSSFLSVVPPSGAMYAFPRVRDLPGFDDAKFAMALLEEEHVLVVPGSSFNVDYRDHFCITLLPDEDTMTEVFGRIERLLSRWAEQARE